MSDETTDTQSSPLYRAFLRLASGHTVLVTVEHDEVHTSITDGTGRAVTARMTSYEADEVGSMHRAAFRICPSPYQIELRKEAEKR